MAVFFISLTSALVPIQSLGNHVLIFPPPRDMVNDCARTSRPL